MEIVLYQAAERDPGVGVASGIVISSPDIEAACHDLREKGPWI